MFIYRIIVKQLIFMADINTVVTVTLQQTPAVVKCKQLLVIRASKVDL